MAFESYSTAEHDLIFSHREERRLHLGNALTPDTWVEVLSRLTYPNIVNVCEACREVNAQTSTSSMWNDIVIRKYSRIGNCIRIARELLSKWHMDDWKVLDRYLWHVDKLCVISQLAHNLILKYIETHSNPNAAPGNSKDRFLMLETCPTENMQLTSAISDVFSLRFKGEHIVDKRMMRMMKINRMLRLVIEEAATRFSILLLHSFSF